MVTKDHRVDTHYAGLDAESRQGPYVLLQVEDSGIGMTRETIGKIFDPFFTTNEVGSGTGLGLSTTMAIVKSQGGFLRIYSEPGGGTKFQVFLPALRDVVSREVDVAEQLPRGLAGNAPGTTRGNLGVTHFLAKPYTAESLLHILQEILAAG